MLSLETLGQCVSQRLGEGVQRRDGVYGVDDFLDRADAGVILEALDQTTDSRCGLLVLQAGRLIRMQQAQMIAQQTENHAARRSRFALLLGQSAKAGMAFRALAGTPCRFCSWRRRRQALKAGAGA
jgi:hypothetical protein